MLSTTQLLKRFLAVAVCSRKEVVDQMLLLEDKPVQYAKLNTQNVLEFFGNLFRVGDFNPGCVGIREDTLVGTQTSAQFEMDIVVFHFNLSKSLVRRLGLIVDAICLDPLEPTPVIGQHRIKQVDHRRFTTPVPANDTNQPALEINLQFLVRTHIQHCQFLALYAPYCSMSDRCDIWWVVSE